MRNVGSIEPEGILNGSAMKERSTSTINRMGKKALEYSISNGSLTSPPGCAGLRCRANHRLSTSHTNPVKKVANTRIREKLTIATRLLFFDLEYRQKSLLRNLDLADLLHPSLAGFLLFQQFALSRYIAAV